MYKYIYQQLNKIPVLFSALAISKYFRTPQNLTDDCK